MRQAAAPAPAAAPTSPSTGPAGTQTAPAPDLLSVAQVAQQLGVAEADVMASIESGDLKAKRIGTQYRVTHTALQAFLAS